MRKCMPLGERHGKRRSKIVLCLAAALVVSIGATSAATTASGAESQGAATAKKCKGKKHGKARKRGTSRKKCLKLATSGPKVTLTVGSTLPGAGTIDSSPAGLSCGTVCTAQFDPGTVVRLSAAQASGYFHTAWYGGGCSDRGDCVVVLNSDTAVVAGFVRQVAVSADIVGSGSVVASAPDAPFGVCAGTGCLVNPGDDVTLTASPDSGYMFDQWSGDCSGTDPVFTFTAIASPDKDCQASFAPLPNVVLTVNFPGTGLGSVTSSPAGINCAANCSASIQQGTMVTLTAFPADGSIFGGWFGPCSGQSPCTFTLNAPTTVNADFVLVDDPTDP
jgi:hypothetical protein